MLLENNPYPFDIRVRLNALALVEAGYDVTVVAQRRKNQPRHETLQGVRVYRFALPNAGAGVLGYLIEFVCSTIILTAMALWVWARHGMDVVHLYSPPDNLLFAGLLPKLAGKIVIYDNRDLSPELYESKFQRAGDFFWRLLRWLERRATRLASHVLVVNESYRQVIMARDGVAQERATAVRIGPELERLRATEPDPALRARAKTIIAYLGQMSYQDGVDHLLRALRHLERDLGLTDWFCVLIGPADDLSALKALAGELGLGERTWFTGFVSEADLLRYLSTADICVDPDPLNPLNNISTMIKMMEYLTFSKPIVAYDLIEHSVTAGEAALYARPNDEMDMARQIARLMADPELRARLGAIGRERVERFLAWKHQKQGLLAVYRALTKWEIASSQADGSASQ
jgi:glycosyltransferase involved in cell wall biosynthesis